MVQNSCNSRLLLQGGGTSVSAHQRRGLTRLEGKHGALVIQFISLGIKDYCAEGLDQVLEHLCSKHQALSSKPTAKKTK